MKRISRNVAACATGALLWLAAAAAGAQTALPDMALRSQIFVYGSTTMEPYTRAIADRLAAERNVRPPIVNSTGTGAGMVAFCEGIGVEYPDILAASRRMTKREFDHCVDNGIGGIVELRIGYTALVLVTQFDMPPIELALEHVYRALAKELIDDEDHAVPNPHKTWKDVDASLPDVPIRVVIPAEGSGSRSMFDDLVMQGGCRYVDSIRRIFSAEERVKACTTLRTDGAVQEVQEPYNDRVKATLQGTKEPLIGLMAHSYFESGVEGLRQLTIDGIAATDVTISVLEYPMTIPLYYYVKKAHMRDVSGEGVVRGLREFIAEAMSEAAIGTGGYLRKHGLTPMPDRRREAERVIAYRLQTFSK